MKSRVKEINIEKAIVSRLLSRDIRLQLLMLCRNVDEKQKSSIIIWNGQYHALSTLKALH